MMNFSDALRALYQGEAIANGNALDNGYLILYEMKDKSIGDKLIICQYPNKCNPSVYQPSQKDLNSNHWRILKPIEL